MALVSGRAVFASALLQAFGHQELDSSWESQWRVFLARGACLAICCGIHMPRLWMCKVLSASLMALWCSESSLAMALGIIEGWYDPAFPPKLSSEQIQDKLTKLRTFVEQNAETLRARRGDSNLRRLRQSAPGEETWYQFF